MRQATHAHTTSTSTVRRPPQPVGGAADRRPDLRAYLDATALGLAAFLAGYLLAGGVL